MSCFQEAIQKRRSIYTLGTQTNVSQNEIIKIIECCLFNAPSAFNSQSARLVLLFGENYQKFWKMVSERLKKVVPAEHFASTEKKIISFSKGIGTILFFEEEKTIQKLQDDFKTYAEQFPKWSEQGNAILQYMIWTALAEKGIGASIQHYNPLIDTQTRQLFQLPESWYLIAQMPFGSIEAPAGVKTHLPLEKRLHIFK